MNFVGSMDKYFTLVLKKDNQPEIKYFKDVISSDLIISSNLTYDKSQELAKKMGREYIGPYVKHITFKTTIVPTNKDFTSGSRSSIVLF